MFPSPENRTFKELLAIARASFSSLSGPERQFLYCLSRPHANAPALQSPAHNPRQRPAIRAELIRHLFDDKDAAQLIGHRGFTLRSARVIGTLDLDSMDLCFPIAFIFCTFTAAIRLRDARTRQLEIRTSACPALTANNIDVHGTLSLQKLRTEGAISLRCARITGDLILRGATLAQPPAERLPDKPVVDLDNSDIGGSLCLNFVHATGEVSLRGAAVRGDLDCRRARLANPRQPRDQARERYALVANDISIRGNVLMTRRFYAAAHVLMAEAKIDGDLDCSGGTFSQSTGNGHALSLDRSNIKGTAYLRKGFCSKGQVRLLGTRIEGDLNCNGGLFLCSGNGQPEQEIAVNALQVHVGGSAMFGCDQASPNELYGDERRHYFVSDGIVTFEGAVIGSDLTFGSHALNSNQADGRFAQFRRNRWGPNGLRAPKVRIGNTLTWLKLHVNRETWLDLQYGKVRHIDLSDEHSWPWRENLNLDGFSYNSIALHRKLNAPTRLLRRQERLRGRGYPHGRFRRVRTLLRLQNRRFHPQPYERMGTVLRESGDESAARSVMVAKVNEWNRIKLERKRKDGSFCGYLFYAAWSIPLNSLYKRFVGYGYRPDLALGWALGIFIAGLGIYAYGYHEGMIVPTDPEACKLFAATPSTRQLPAYHPEFNVFFYTLDVFVPGIDLQQEGNWRPTHVWDLPPSGQPTSTELCVRKSSDPPEFHSPTEVLVTYYESVAVVAGWILIALGLLGPKGVLRRA